MLGLIVKRSITIRIPSAVSEIWPRLLLSDALNLDVVSSLKVQIRRAIGRVEKCSLAVFGSIEEFESAVCDQGGGEFGFGLLCRGGSSHA
jgi:hypothetical protein